MLSMQTSQSNFADVLPLMFQPKVKAAKKPTHAWAGFLQFLN